MQNPKFSIGNKISVASGAYKGGYGTIHKVHIESHGFEYTVIINHKSEKKSVRIKEKHIR